MFLDHLKCFLLMLTSKNKEQRQLVTLLFIFYLGSSFYLFDFLLLMKVILKPITSNITPATVIQLFD